jgi:hypothetical protein
LSACDQFKAVFENAGSTGNNSRQVIAKLHTLVVERLSNRIPNQFLFLAFFTAGVFSGRTGFFLAILSPMGPAL